MSILNNLNNKKPSCGNNGHVSRKKRLVQHYQWINLMLMAYDAAAVSLAFFLALWLRFDCRFSMMPDEYLTSFIKFCPFYAVFCIVVFRLLGLYKSIWRFVSFVELKLIIYSTLITGAFHVAAITLFVKRMPISYYFIGIVLQFIFIIAVRFSYRFILLLRKQSSKGHIDNRIMVIGAGEAGRIILRELIGQKDSTDKVCCIIDDNPNKHKRYIEGVPVVGGRDDILSACEDFNINKIYFAIPTASREDKRDILNICKETSCELRSLPTILKLADGKPKLSDMKEVAIEDLLGRDPISVDMTEIFSFISGKTILVTGGGGSIGSELCRQIAEHHPRTLIIFDVYENSAYNIQQELVRRHPELDLQVLIGSVRDSRRVNEVFRRFRPDVVYHAAAHKHVPLMEVSPCEAIKNNAIGTYKVAYAAMMNGCSRFVLISTDKAVNPTNIMGASKRLCEMIVQTFDQKIKSHRENDLPVLHVHMDDEDGSMRHMRMPGGEAIRAKTEFVAVRFGNVLGSNGSVIPLFKQQIAEGGPLTVTHPDIIRYFMTIPEAVSLVLQAGTYAKGGEIFVLDMGSPVKIDDLARNLIKLSGFKPDEDIKIEYTGLRPGEKLYEEKLMAEEGLQRTDNELIHIGRSIPFDEDAFLKALEQLMNAAYENVDCIRDMVMDMVDTYHPEGAATKDETYRKQMQQIEMKKQTEEVAEGAAV